MNSPLGTYEMELVTIWLEDMKDDIEYQEPLLDTSITALVNYICNTLQQDIHVFISSVQLLEDYIKLKKKLIEDPALLVTTVVFICNKFTGDQDIKAKSFEALLLKLTGYHYTVKNINIQELEILTTLNGILPLWTIVDDLKTLVSNFEHEYKLKVSLIPACIDVLELIYMSRKDWFCELKHIYNLNTETLMVFKKLMCSRNYLPLSILGYVIKFSKYRFSLNTDVIMMEMALQAGIHIDHVTASIEHIRKLYLEG